MVFQTALVFGDYMVLQRNKRVPVWGKGTPEEIVRVKIQGQQWETRVCADGSWKAEIGPLHQEEDLAMELESGEKQICLKHVAVGEVWIAGGQSNMEFQMEFEQHYKEELLVCHNPLLRFFDYPEVSYQGELKEKEYPYDGFWRKADPGNLPYFSAVSYYFGKQLQSCLKIPIGMIGCNWGGTTASAWMNPAYLENTDGAVWLQEYREGIRQYEEATYEAAFSTGPDSDRTNLLGNPIYRGMLDHEVSLQELQELYELAVKNGGLSQLMGPKWPGRPGGLYETMLKKVAPYGMRGVIWYQGESDAPKGEVYRVVFSRLVRCWRELWQEQFPFLFVQLAPYEGYQSMGGSQYPVIRECQQQAADQLEGVGMAVITDCGMRYDIHPKNKKAVGERLALQAERRAYNIPVACEAPRLIKGEWERGSMVLTFSHSGAGLALAGQEVNGLEIIQGQQRVLPERTHVEGNRVILTGKQLDSRKRTEIRLAWSAYYQMNLYNDAGLPARPGRLTIEAQY